MGDITILGDGPLGRAVETAARERGDEVRVLGRPADRPASARRPCAAPASSSRRRAATRSAPTSRPRSTPAAAGSSSPRPAGPAARADVDAMLREHGAAAVAASNFSIGVVLFGRLVEAAVGLFGPLEAFDPYLLEWHRRSKRDRPSGTAADLARRIADAHPRLDGPGRSRGRLGQGGRLARDAPRRLRRRRARRSSCA